MADKLFLTPTIFLRARQRVAANDPRWMLLKSLADPAANWDCRPVNYALAYALTGTASYAAKAIQLAGVFVGQSVAAVEDNRGFPCREVLPEVALTLNWCGDQMTAAQRENWLAVLEAQCRWVWPDTNPSRKGGHGLWVTSNYFWGFMMTLLAGCALLPDRPFGQTLIDQASTRFQATATPRMRPGGGWEGAAMEEGTSYGYGSLMYMAESISAFFSSRSVDPGWLLPATWIPSLVRATIHLTAPDLAHLYPGGDQARISNAPVSDYTMAALLPLLPYADAETAGMARFWIDQVYANRNRVASVAWQQLLFYPDVGPIDYRAKLPLSLTMPGVGVMSTRNSWAPDAVQVVCVGGPVRDNDHDDDTGTFHIRRGAAVLAGSQKEWGSSGGEHKAAALNTVLIGGKSQPGKQEDTHVLFSQDNPVATSWAADLTGAYPDDLDEWRREVLFVKPNFVVVFDRVKTKVASTEKRWLLHTLHAAVQNGNLFQTSTGGSTLYGTPVLLPIGATVTQERLSTGSYRTSIKSSISPAYFLNVLEILPSGQPQTLPIFATPASGNVRTLRLGSSAVEVTLDAREAPALRVVGDQPPPPPPPPSALTVRITNFAPDPAGAVFYGVVNDTAPLAAGSTISVVITTPSGTTATLAATIGGVPPPPPPSGALYLEAESAVLVAPMTLRTVAGASGAGTDTPNSGSATFTVQIPTTGTWSLWARVIARDKDSDSFGVSVDGGASDVFDAAENSWAPDWRWTRLNGRGGTGNPMTLNPRKLTLTVGPHTIRFSGREPGTLLDRLALSMDPAFRPE